MLLDQFSVLWNGTVWLSAKGTRAWIWIDAGRDTIDMADVTEPHLFLGFEHGEELGVICFFFNMIEVDHVAEILWRFGCVRLAIDSTVFGGRLGYRRIANRLRIPNGILGQSSFVR